MHSLFGEAASPPPPYKFTVASGGVRVYAGDLLVLAVTTAADTRQAVITRHVPTVRRCEIRGTTVTGDTALTADVRRILRELDHNTTRSGDRRPGTTETEHTP